jgi:hypothetical protein
MSPSLGLASLEQDVSVAWLIERAPADQILAGEFVKPDQPRWAELDR